jgi:hypothetical protein
MKNLHEVISLGWKYKFLKHKCFFKRIFAIIERFTVMPNKDKQTNKKHAHACSQWAHKQTHMLAQKSISHKDTNEHRSMCLSPPLRCPSIKGPIYNGCHFHLIHTEKVCMRAPRPKSRLFYDMRQTTHINKLPHKVFSSLL